MIPVNSIPTDLLSSLTSFSDWFFQQDRGQLKLSGMELDPNYFCSVEYLKNKQEEPHSGFPDNAKGVDMNIMGGYDVELYQPKILKLDTDIKNFICSRACALKMYYPAGGFIDWHTNENASGYNVLLTYSTTGKGAFMYQHPITKEIVNIPDKQGWNMKVGMYDRHDGTPLWHAAYTECERLTWAYILDQSGWDALVDDLSIDRSTIDNVYGKAEYRPTFKSLAVYN